jgi:adenylyl-sulfate kinase
MQNVEDTGPLPQKGEHSGGGVVLWLTGLSGAGKTTIANLLSGEFSRRELPVEVLDGDRIRRNLSQGLGFSRQDRRTNIRRIAFVSNLLSRHGVNVIVAAISPYRSMRNEARAFHDRGHFVEVFVDCPMRVLIERDVKGLYKKALSGEIENFTGISDPYESLMDPDIVIQTDTCTPETGVARIVQWLDQNNLCRFENRGDPQAEAFLAAHANPHRGG